MVERRPISEANLSHAFRQSHRFETARAFLEQACNLPGLYAICAIRTDITSYRLAVVFSGDPTDEIRQELKKIFHEVVRPDASKNSFIREPLISSVLQYRMDAAKIRPRNHTGYDSLIWSKDRG